MFTKELEAVLHLQATCQYEARAYDKASGMFRMLTLFCPTNGVYWFGLGASLMLAGHERQAVQPFHMASILSPTDPKAFIHLAECHARLGDEVAKDGAFCQAESLCKKNGHTIFLKQVQALKATL